MANSFRTRQLITSYRIKSPCVFPGKNTARPPTTRTCRANVNSAVLIPVPTIVPSPRPCGGKAASLLDPPRSITVKKVGRRPGLASQIPTVPSTVCRHQDVTQLREVRGSARTRAPLYSCRLQPCARVTAPVRKRASERASRSGPPSTSSTRSTLQ
jgi:hypothetical protein